MGPSLEEQLNTLIGEYRRLKTAAVTMNARFQEQDEARAQLEEDNRVLRATIDELNVDRFSLKRLKDERKAVRRKLGTALERLDALEMEVSGGEQ